MSSRPGLPSGFLMPEVSAPVAADALSGHQPVLTCQALIAKCCGQTASLLLGKTRTPGLPQPGWPHREAGQPPTPAALLWASPSSRSAWAAAPPTCSPEFTREPEGCRRAPRSLRSRRSGRPQEEQLDMALPLTVTEQVFLFPVRPSGCSSA